MMRVVKRNQAFLLLAAALFAGSCSKTEPPKEAPKEVVKEPAAAPKSQTPDTFKVKFETTKGDFVVEVHRDWAPKGADRFYELVKAGFYDGGGFYRVIKGFMVQFGLNPDPAVNSKWHSRTIADDPVTKSNTRGRITFATGGPSTRTTQVFISFGNNSRLDAQGFSPFGQVTEGGMDVVDKIYSGYGEGAPDGAGPDQGRVEAQGNAYLKPGFPKMDFVKKASIEP